MKKIFEFIKNKKIDNKYAVIIFIVFIVFLAIIGFGILDILAYKGTIKYITEEYKKIYVENYELENDNKELIKQNLYLREENLSIGKELERLKGVLQ